MIDLYQHLSTPIIAEKIDVLRTDHGDFVRATATDGQTGIMRANQRLYYMLPMFKELVVPYFLGKDLRDLPNLIATVDRYQNNYKYTGLMLWNSMAHVELALLDLLGKAAGKSVGALLATVIRTEIPIYLSSTTRTTTPEEEVDWLTERLEQSGAQAVKFKIGGRMSNNADAFPGRTENLVPLARKTFGDAITIYVDANSSYDAPTAIEIGHMLEDHGVALFEEPCPFEDYDATKQVTEALSVPVGSCEQENSLARFASVIRNQVVDLVQPDVLYNGGLMRCLQVAEMAAVVGYELHTTQPKCRRQYGLHGPFRFDCGKQRSLSRISRPATPNTHLVFTGI